MSGVSSDLLIYSFDGISFARAGYNLGDPEWVVDAAIRTVDPILDASQQYRDFGGTAPQAFGFTAAFVDEATRNAMVHKVGKVATLSKSTTGEGRTLMLTQAQKAQPAAALFCAVLSWE